MIRLAVILAAFYSAARFLVLSSDPNPVLNTLSLFFFPRDMVIYVGAGAIVLSWKWCKDRLTNKETLSAGFPILLIYSSALAFRILTKMMPIEYSIYYNGRLGNAFRELCHDVRCKKYCSERSERQDRPFAFRGCTRYGRRILGNRKQVRFPTSRRPPAGVRSTSFEYFQRGNRDHEASTPYANIVKLTDDFIF